MIKFTTHFFRKAFKKGTLTWLNIAGLIMGMFTFIFIYFYVYVENSYDNYIDDSEHIYHVYANIERGGKDNICSSTPIPLGEEFEKAIPQITAGGTYASIFETNVVSIGEKSFLNADILYGNTGLVNVFRYKTLYGSMDHVLDARGNCIITRSAAKKYFGTEDAIGKSFEVNHDQQKQIDVSVSCVIEDIPSNSNVKFEMLCSMEDYLYVIGKWVGSWRIKAGQNYIRIAEGTNMADLDPQMNQVIERCYNQRKDMQHEHMEVFAESINEKHFQKDYTLTHPTESFVNPVTVRVLLIIGIITLLISWLNFMNFSYAQNIKSHREIGIRKILGSGRTTLFLRLLKESVLLAIIPGILSVVLFFIFAPVLAKSFHLNITDVKINSFRFWTTIGGVLLAGSVLVSAFPVLKLSSLQPVVVLKSKLSKTSGRNNGRGYFLIAQFALSVALVSGIILIDKQLKFVKSKSLGFNQENILLIPPPITENRNDFILKMKRFKQEMTNSSVEGTETIGSSAPGKSLEPCMIGLLGKPETEQPYFGFSTDHDYFNVVNVALLAGRQFSDDYQSNYGEAIINRKMCEQLGFATPEEAIDRKLTWKNFRIIGVVENYNHTSLHQPIKPTMYWVNLKRIAYLMLKFKGSDFSSNLQFIEKKWNETFQNSPFEYTLLDDQFNQQYAKDDQLSLLVTIFSVISVIITLLGLIGSCIYESQNRIKEIGIRKVNGATIAEILGLFNLSYAKWIIIGLTLGCPIGLWGFYYWIESFAYRTPVSWWIFALSGIAMVAIASLTISWQSWKAATRNPVEALRYE